jgi:hypothetical protein
VPCFVCVTCGVQHGESAEPPARCAVCEDERQYVGHGGQQWTTLEELRRDHRGVLVEEEPGLVGVGTDPSLAIGQRALLVRTPDGNLLWDCITVLDDALVGAVHGLGGVRAIAISHPHYYSSNVEWSRAFDGAPVYLHADDREWVMRPDPCVDHWQGDQLELFGGLTLYRLGGHFAGAAVCHWPEGAEGRGVLLTGDTIQVIPDRRWVSFMWSYPNLVPLDGAAIRTIAERVAPVEFDRIYGAWFGRVVPSGAKDAVARSAARYIEKITAT